jgi:DNA repair protein RadC
MDTDRADRPHLGNPPFRSTGPQGHRGRMRTRLLSSGPDGLADYELLEMLLFLSIPRRDTKPQAKAIINHFGDLCRSFTAKAAELRGAGLDHASIGVIELVREAARRLATADAVSRPLLNNTERLMAYLDPPVRLQGPSHLAVLLLNNRNQLLAEMPCADTQEPASVAHAVARRALEVHATAMILATFRAGAKIVQSDRDYDLTRRIARVAEVLSMTLHDHMIFGDDETVSLKRQGRL